ncbi:hypothetical protein [Pseudonocardia sp. ICBG601]|uniref:hypothetical protein n=1 Tax=Pseudonocardia sp. ICBG601 TaxID=2846759 RepID=UPI001CF6EAC3|nr:hypothetical protein [Pseudonocardia sp. ICBG601]
MITTDRTIPESAPRPSQASRVPLILLMHQSGKILNLITPKAIVDSTYCDSPFISD